MLETSPAGSVELTDATMGESVAPGGLRSVKRGFLSRPGLVASAIFLVALLIAAVWADAIAPYDPNLQDLLATHQGPSRGHLLGTDSLGRDMLSRLIFGARVSLGGALQAVGIAALIGVPFGLLAGYSVRWVDGALNGGAEAVQSIPPLLLAITLVGVLGPGLTNAMLAVGIVLSVRFFRLARTSAASLREEPFVDASVVAGAPVRAVLWRHVLPNSSGPLLVEASIAFGIAIMAEASLSFLGLGVEIPQASWGAMIKDGFQNINQSAWGITPASVMIAATLLVVMNFGEALRLTLTRTAPKRPRSGRVHSPQATSGLATIHTVAEDVPPAPGVCRVLEISGLGVGLTEPTNDLPLVTGLSLAIERGETVGLVGESGCGKSMTALAVAGVLPPGVAVYSGSVRLEGREILGLPIDQLRTIQGHRIGMIYQDPTRSLDPSFTVGDQIAEVARQHLGLSRKESVERAIEMLDLVGIRDARARAQDYPHMFSGGMCQRVMIAIALVCEPALLIADEPTTALDVTVQAGILRLLASLQERLGLAILLITHDLGVVGEVCDRVAVMYAGQIVEQADVEALFAHPRHPYTAGMLAAIPRSANRNQPLLSIPGQVPAPHEWPIGCRFSGRCQYVTASLCTAGAIQLRSVGARGHTTRCARAEQLSLAGVDEWGEG